MTLKAEGPYPYVITVASEKGGVGKTTVATNLAVYLKAVLEDLPVTVLSLDNHGTVDKMFALSADGSTVADFLTGQEPAPPALGQFGVQFFRSSLSLDGLAHCYANPFTLTSRFADAGITGVVIVDTRPVLDVFTQNALFAADIALIPVKDSASLDNCRNIFSLFDRRGVDHSALALLPCLVDARVKYHCGPFADLKALLRAFAKSRGYRCLEQVIPKSPRVEALNTNPEGRVYPVLTHGKQTDVHGQFHLLAQAVLESLGGLVMPRAQAFAHWRSQRDAERARAREARLARLGGTCPLCGAEAGSCAGYYCETSGDGVRSFAHAACVERFLLQELLGGFESGRRDGALLGRLRAALRDVSYLISAAEGGALKVCACTGSEPPLEREIPADGAAALRLARLVEGGERLVIVPCRGGELMEEDGYRCFTQLKESILQPVHGSGLHQCGTSGEVTA